MFYKLYELLWEYNNPVLSPKDRAVMLPVKRAIVGMTAVGCLLILSLPFIFLYVKWLMT